MACKNCISKYPSSCIEWQGDTTFGDNFEEVINKLINVNQDLEVDLKTLSVDDLSKNKIVQLLIDEIIKLKVLIGKIDNTTNTETVSCSIPLGNVTSTDLCSILKFIISEINSLKLEVNTLKNNEYL